MAEALTEQADDVAVVERVEDHAPFAAGPDEPEIAQKSKLVRDRRLGHPDQGGEVADAQLAVGQGVEDPHTRRIAEGAKRLHEVRHIVRSDERRPELGDTGGMEMDDVTEVRPAAAADI